MRNCLTYYLALQDQAQLQIGQVKRLIGKDELREAFDILEVLGLSGEEEKAFFLLRNRWSRNEKNSRKGTSFTQDYLTVSNQIIEEFLDFTERLIQGQKSASVSLRSGASNLYLEDQLKLDWFFGENNLFRKLEWLRNSTPLSKSIAKVLSPDGTGSGIITKDFHLYTAFSLLPDPEKAKEVSIIIPSRNGTQEYELEAQSWEGESHLGIARAKIKTGTFNPLFHQEYIDSIPQNPMQGRDYIQISHESERSSSLIASPRTQTQQFDHTLHLKNHQGITLAGTPVFNSNWELIGLVADNQGNKVKLFSSFMDWLANKTTALVKPEQVPDKDQSLKLRFSPHHQYTCDRNFQFTAFKVYELEKSKDQKAHFFYLHGGDKQAHSGLFKRFSNFLARKGSEQNIAKLREVKRFKINFPGSPNERLQRIEIPEKLMRKLGISDNEKEQIKDKCLKSILENPGAKIYNMSAESAVCMLFSIPEAHWYKDITPAIASWFIESFCLRDLPNDGPEFYIFFAIEYRQDHPDIREQIAQALEKKKYMIELPELDMVPESFIKAWFEEHEDIWEDDEYTMRKTYIKHFHKFPSEMFMQDVQFELGAIIEDINKSEKDANRYS